MFHRGTQQTMFHEHCICLGNLFSAFQNLDKGLETQQQIIFLLGEKKKKKKLSKRSPYTMGTAVKHFNFNTCQQYALQFWGLLLCLFTAFLFSSDLGVFIKSKAQGFCCPLSWA